MFPTRRFEARESMRDAGAVLCCGDCLPSGETISKFEFETRDAFRVEERTNAVVKQCQCAASPKTEAVEMTTFVNDGCNWEGEDAGNRCLRTRFCNEWMDAQMFLAVVMAELQGTPSDGSLWPIKTVCCLPGTWSP